MGELTIIKIQKVRCDLQRMEVKKSMENKFSSYFYYVLGDFVPQVNDLCLKYGITPVCTFTKEKAIMTVYNHDDKDDVVIFELPFVVPQLKASNSAQMVGSAQSYFIRYLYLNAFTLCESDYFESLSPEDNQEVKPMNKAKEELINKIKANVKNEKVAKKLVEVLKTSDAKKVDDLPSEKLKEIINVIE